MALIYSKTTAGQAALQSRSVLLTPRQRSAFIMFDGKRTSDEILRLTSGIGVTQTDLDLLLEKELLELVGAAAVPVVAVPAAASRISVATPAAPVADLASTTAAASKAEPGAVEPDARASYLKAYPVATRLTSALGLRGFRLTLAVEAAGNLQQLRELAPKIRDAVGADKFRELEEALR